MMATGCGARMHTLHKQIWLRRVVEKTADIAKPLPIHGVLCREVLSTRASTAFRRHRGSRARLLSFSALLWFCLALLASLLLLETLRLLCLPSLAPFGNQHVASNFFVVVVFVI